MDQARQTFPASVSCRLVRGSVKKARNKNLLGWACWGAALQRQSCTSEHLPQAVRLCSCSPVPVCSLAFTCTAWGRKHATSSFQEQQRCQLEVPGKTPKTRQTLHTYSFCLQERKSRVYYSSLLFDSSISGTNDLHISFCRCLLQRDFWGCILSFCFDCCKTCLGSSWASHLPDCKQ